MITAAIGPGGLDYETRDSMSEAAALPLSSFDLIDGIPEELSELARTMRRRQLRAGRRSGVRETRRSR